MQTLGIRLNNPGNIEHGDPWQGLHKEQTHERFCRFVSPEYGIRAMAKIIGTYRRVHRGKNGTPVDTIREVIERWAPPSENPTEAYIKNVGTWAGIDPEAVIDLRAPTALVPVIKGIVRQENGTQPYSDAVIRAGVRMAG